MKPGRIRDLRKIIESDDPRLKLRVAPPRLATSPQAAMLLQQIVEEVEPSEIIVSVFGIREGLIFSKLKPAARRLDPLIEEARDAGGGERRFGQHGDLLDEWIAPLFDDPPAMRRLRLASCLLADVAWQANPAFRADRAIEMALHGNWVAVKPGERVLLAQALSSNFGRQELPDQRLEQLCKEGQLRTAHCWGTAMRLGQRLSGGVSSVLERTRLSCDEDTIRLHVQLGEEALAGDMVDRRLIKLGEAMGRDVEIVTGD
jgi:exopolyphosphatase/guanosine-5'-triphosphate,3'-diphosphate pyrophosphatase